MNKNRISEIFDCKILKVFPCGSRITCNPPIMDTDEDWIVLVDADEMLSLEFRLDKLGYTLGGSIIVSPGAIDWASSGQIFFSYKREEVNFIITTSKEFCAKFELATALSKELNIMKKKDRISLFQVILYGNNDFST